MRIPKVFDAFDWESFSAAWNQDLKMSCHFVKQAFALPLRPGLDPHYTALASPIRFPCVIAPVAL